MSFVNAMKFGVSPETEAIKFTRNLLERSFASDELCLPLAAEFINELFKVIGLRTKITEQQLKDGEGFDWLGAGCATYMYKFNSEFLSQLQRFLLQMFNYVLEQNERHDITDELTPVLILLELLTHWCHVYGNLMQQSAEIQTQYLEEPLAHINLQLLVGAHKTRKKYHLRYHLFNSICGKLVQGAIQGLYYVQARPYIVGNMMPLVAEDFGICPEFAHDSKLFILEAFSATTHKIDYINIFKCLENMLLQYSTDPSSFRYKALKEFLIDTAMQGVYFTTLKFEKTKRLLVTTLKFLNTLQSKLLDLDCFQQVFIEEILSHTMNTDDSIALPAAQLYMEVARRKQIADDILLKHIIEFFYIRMGSIKTIPTYVTSLWRHFPYMQSMKSFYSILTDENVPQELLSITGHFTIAAYRIMLQNFERYAQHISFILEKLPTLLRELKCLATKGALLMLYNFIDFHLLRYNCSNSNEILEQFEDYVLSEFKHNKNLQYPYLLNLFMRFLYCVEETKHFHKLENCGVYVFSQYEDIERVLAQYDETSKKPKIAQLRRYCDIIQKLNVILKPGYNILDSLKRLLHTLSQRVIDKNQITEFAKSVPFLDAYATELIVNSCIKFSCDVDITVTQKEWLAMQVQRLANHLIEILRKEEIETHMRLVYIKSVFNSAVNLYYVFNTESTICKLPLNSEPYNILINAIREHCLLKKAFPIDARMNYDEQLEMHPQRIPEYQKLMLQKFTQLHSNKKVIIPSPAIWKLCLHMGLKTPFENELSDLLKATVLYHFNIFTQVQAIVVYNLYARLPQRENLISSTIKLHKSFIDDLPAQYLTPIINVNLVLQVLQMLQQALIRLKPKTGLDRLKILKHLNHFTENVDINNDNVLNDLMTEAKALKNHMLSDDEQASLKTYLSVLEKYTTKDTSKTA